MTSVHRTRVAIIGAGPAGLVLSHMLTRQGIDCTVLERRSRGYVESRLRAGVLEQNTVELIRELGLNAHMDRDGLEHHGIYLQHDGQRFHIPMTELCGRSVTVYGQTELTRDLIAARLESGGALHFEAEVEGVHDPDSDHPAISYRFDGEEHRLECDFIIGCDGFHGPCRNAIPEHRQRLFDNHYPYGWLGILARVPPSTDELIYAAHRDGFAMHSMRSPEISRLYLQVTHDDHPDNWSDDRIWEALEARLGTPGWTLQRGPILDRSITPMRSFVAETMQYGRLFLAGDSAHIVPPTGAKGLNLAIADIRVLGDALIAHYLDDDEHPLKDYNARVLWRVWRANAFSNFMTGLLHNAPEENPYEHQLRMSRIDYLHRSTAAATALAENYTGMPFDASQRFMTPP
ncbi:p-hydroxybenzoate 3-monooxygenase [Kushneria sinocarnis]|uniref:p-hydroxybenzoate 3-monooxygenase n=1 Tax=Kushneria sinocarnis TaxID=595502 RepID=A0A420WWA6_9GAMM|nr:4-hydroxybenzoate 3-monooxygenase [Kushneria sinocarnis]RKR03408.1 p-hydroxybenzoate 3-monooxygenase [Kushneria sinocarnis]